MKENIEMINVEGTVEDIIYRNDANGYTILNFLKEQDNITLVGYMPFVNVGDNLEVSGEWTKHPDFGVQLKVQSFEKKIPTTVESIKIFLASGLIKGVGKATATRIVEKFGKDTLNIIQSNPERLVELKGISSEKALKISETINQHFELRKITMFFAQYGISNSHLSVIYKLFGNNTIEKIKENPYILTDEKIGISFKIADHIAQNLGVELYLKERIQSGIKYILYQASVSGHVYLPLKILKERTEKLLDVDEETVDNQVIELSFGTEVVFEKNEQDMRVYLIDNYYAENYVAAKLAQLSLVNYIDETEAVLKKINEFEVKENIFLEKTQKEAIIEAVTKGVFILTGGPGTGKTTIIKGILYILEKDKLKTLLGAPTGRAAKRMTEVTGMEAKTIHRLLEIGFENGEKGQVFNRNEMNPIEADVVIIDEMSMVDMILMSNLLKAISNKTRLILVGDINQLSSVGVGNVLKDIIVSNRVKTVSLTKVFRQAQESLIISNAHKINKGEKPELTSRQKDFFFLSRTNSKDVIDTVIELCSERLPRSYGYDPMKHIQVITPTRKGELGVINLNNKLQNVLNPQKGSKKEKNTGIYKLRVGDKVMQMRNNYNITWYKNENSLVSGDGIFNGDIGIIDDIDFESETATVVFEDQRVAKYEFDLLEELETSYAITVHKSQGSEFPVVILPLLEGPSVLFTRNLLYTAVTRAKELVIIVGSRDAVSKMVDNFREDRRFSALEERIQNYFTN